jgi:hypothetical protein
MDLAYRFVDRETTESGGQGDTTDIPVTTRGSISAALERCAGCERNRAVASSGVSVLFDTAAPMAMAKVA